LTPTPIWVSNKSSLAAKLKFWKPTVEIPITQAGNGARYLGETEIAFKPNGAADRFRTTGRVIPLSDVEPNAAMQSSIAAQTADIENLKAESFNATATSAYSSENVRNRETALGNLMADAILSGTKKAFPDDAPQIALVHSGGIREGLPAGRDINRLDIANTVMNAGHKSEEQTELAMVDLTGKQIQGALEYGLRDIPAPPAQTIGQRLANLFTGVPEEHYDQPGNYVQVSGLKYSYDLARNPWEPGRVTNVTVRGADGNYTPIQPESSYRVVTRFHPIDKYTKFGLLGEGTPDQVQAALNLKAVPLSQVDLIGDYISGKTIDPSTFSAPDGRITDLTRRAAVGGITPTPFVAGQATGRENAEQRK
ncbi:MAG TPA: 5'-nucleotidase, partial [Chroococcales cyanobacterium]